MVDDSDEVSPVKRREFEELRRSVRSLERTVETQQEQIARLKHRLTTDAGDVGSSNGELSVPSLSAVQKEVLAILEEMCSDGASVSVDLVKQRAAEAGHLRSSSKNAIRGWLNEGYLSGDLDGSVKVVEWPPQSQKIK